MEEIKVRFSMLSASPRHELLIKLMNLHQSLKSQSNGLETMNTVNIPKRSRLYNDTGAKRSETSLSILGLI